MTAVDVTPPASVPPISPTPWFSVTMTVRNDMGWIAASLASILPQLERGGELVVVDAESTDGTWELLRSTARTHPEMRVLSQRCNRGIGRNLAVARSRAPIVLTQVDADNRYANGVLSSLAQYLRERPSIGLAFAVGAGDVDPSLTRFYAWRREAFDLAGGYPDTQEREDPPLLLRAFRAGVPIVRSVFPRVADDLKPRTPGQAPTVPPWRRATHTMWAARRFRVLGYRYREYARLLGLTRRTTPRYLAGLGLGLLAYAQGALHRDGIEVINRDIPAQPVPAAAASAPPDPRR